MLFFATNTLPGSANLRSEEEPCGVGTQSSKKEYHLLVLVLIPQELGLGSLRRGTAKPILTPLSGHNEVDSGSAAETWIPELNIASRGKCPCNGNVGGTLRAPEGACFCPFSHLLDFLQHSS